MADKLECSPINKTWKLVTWINPSFNFEGLERRFQDEIFNLIKEQADAEDAENISHKEIEINDKYEEKLSSLRAQQAIKREEFLGKELEERLRQYQQAETGVPLITSVPTDHHSTLELIIVHKLVIWTFTERGHHFLGGAKALKEGFHTLGDETMTKLVLGTSGLVLKGSKTLISHRYDPHVDQTLCVKSLAVRE